MKPCKYGCGQQLEWDTVKSKFVEPDRTEHTKERCAYMKSILPKASNTTATFTQASNQRNGGYDAEGAKKGHEENIAMHKESMAILNKLNDSIANLVTTLKVREAIDDEMRQHLENIDRHIMQLLPFPTADKIAEEKVE